MTTSSARAREIPYTRQHIDADDIGAVTAVLRSDWLTTGPAIEAFERCVASYCKARFGVAVSSATAGLHAALHAIGIGKGDRVWTSPNSFVASANCALYCGAAIDFVDIDPLSACISPLALEKKLAAAKKDGTLPKALVAVHYGGHPCDLQSLAAQLRPHGIALVEDASHALGATYAGSPIGSCEFSDAVVFSFQATKSIATGEGGMVLTNRESVARGVRLFRWHGISRDADTDEGGPREPWEYEQTDLGFNYLMTDMQAALGVSQMSKLHTFVKRRRELAATYNAAFQSLAADLPYQAANAGSAWHLYPLRLASSDPQSLRRELYETLERNGISSQVHFIPIHTQPYYRQLGFCAGDFPEAERHYARELSLPLFFDLDNAGQQHVIDVVRSVVPGKS